MSDEEKTKAVPAQPELTEEEKRRREAYEKQKAKVEAVAKDESGKKPDTVMAASDEALPEENFEEAHVDHVDLSEKQEETAMKAKEDYTGKDIEILQGTRSHPSASGHVYRHNVGQRPAPSGPRSRG
jgi:hypothetical protein